jgi:hypothetical protein
MGPSGAVGAPGDHALHALSEPLVVPVGTLDNDRAGRIGHRRPDRQKKLQLQLSLNRNGGGAIVGRGG